MVKNGTKPFTYTTYRIGGTLYKVKIVFNDHGTETMEDQILRMVRNEILEKDRFCGTMNVPQMSRQSERSA